MQISHYNTFHFWDRSTFKGLGSKSSKTRFNRFKELRHCVFRIMFVWSSFCSIRLYISLQFLAILFQNYFFYVSFGSLSVLYFELWCLQDFITVICINHNLSQCYLWFCSYLLKAICKFVKTWNLCNKNATKERCVKR